MNIIDNGHADFERFWRQGELQFPGATIFYTWMFRQFQLHLFAGKMAFDDSFVVVSDTGELYALVPLFAFAEADGGFCYRYDTAYLRGPLVCCAPGRSLYDKVIEFVIDAIEAKAKAKDVRAHWVMLEPVELMEGRHYFNYFLEYGYQDASSVTTMIDLSLPEEALWSNVRKSYRPLISRERRRSQLSIITSENYDFKQCEEYRHLHALAAGRVTRPAETFYDMYGSIEQGKAFLVLVRDDAGVARGAYYFLYHRDNAYYGSAATDPSLSQQSGVGHLGLWQGIVLAKQKGCRFLDLGLLLLRAGVTQKEINIDLFKRGFGGKRVAVFSAQKRFVTC